MLPGFPRLTDRIECLPDKGNALRLGGILSGGEKVLLRFGNGHCPLFLRIVDPRMDKQRWWIFTATGSVRFDVGKFRISTLLPDSGFFIVITGNVLVEGVGVPDRIGNNNHDRGDTNTLILAVQLDVILMHLTQKIGNDRLDIAGIDVFVTDVVVDVPVDWHRIVADDGIILDGNSWNFGKACFDGINQWIVGDGPWEQVVLEISRATEIHWSGRQVEDLSQSTLLLQGSQDVEPEGRLLLKSFIFQIGSGGRCARRLVTVMSFVVQDDDVFGTPVSRQEAGNHFVGIFCPGFGLLASVRVQEFLDNTRRRIFGTFDRELGSSLKCLEVLYRHGVYARLGKHDLADTAFRKARCHSSGRVRRDAPGPSDSV